MDKLGKLKYENPDMLFKYKGEVGVPALEMVDDIVEVQKCGVDTIRSNAVVNSITEHKKLTLNANKCHKIHCGHISQCLTNMKVHDTSMHQSSEEKHLDDQINQNTKHASTIAKRRAKSNGIISDIIQILDVIPGGRSRIKIPHTGDIESLDRCGS